MSRDELIVVVRRQGERIAVQDQQISAQAGQLAELMEANETLAGRLARLDHLLSRNSGNSSMPPSGDDGPGKPAPPEPKRRGGPKRSRGKQPGAPGSHLGFTDNPDDRQDRFPQGSCGCGADLGGARDLGVVDRFQQHDIPQVSVKVVQFDQHQVQCGCGEIHTATRPAGSRPGPVGYGPLCRHNGPWGYPFNRSSLVQWIILASEFTIRGRWASSRPGSGPMPTAWTTCGGCAGRTGLGRCRMAPLADASAVSLHAFVTDHVAPGATVITDAWQGYCGLDTLGYVHDRRSQRAARARGEDPGELLPAVHRIASLTKRWLLGTHQGSVETAHLPSYLNEFVFRFNRRRSRSRGLVFYRVLELAVDHDPVRYHDLIASKRPRKGRPAPPRARGNPPTLERPPANRPWRTADQQPSA